MGCARRLLVIFASLALIGTSPKHETQQTLSAGGMKGVPITVAPETLFHTIASDFFVQRDGTIYVQTGDIPAMWLRDAAAQTLPYVRLGRSRPLLRTWIRAVIAREARNIAIDPYANAFRANYTVWERKWEVDSLAYPVLLAWAYENEGDDRHVFDAAFHDALGRIVATYDCERRHDRCSTYHRDRGPAPEIGMIWSAYRPSDDATKFAYNVPQQMIAAVALRDVADLALSGYGDHALATRATSMAAELDAAIARYGTVRESRCGGTVYAYETDGRGRFSFMDDANIPSLLAAPLEGYVSIADPVYRRTRDCVLSAANPYFFRGGGFDGVGSPHTPRGYIWPLALIVRALTSSRHDEILEQLRALAASTGKEGLVHESFDPHDPRKFTRAEFGWGNAMYAELLFRAAAGYPAQAVTRPQAMSLGPLVPESIAVVDEATAIENRGVLIRGFERACPLKVIGDSG